MIGDAAKGVAMILKRIETFATADVGFVRVTAEDGAQGWGQVSTVTVISPVRYCTVRWRRGCWCRYDRPDDLLDLVTEREHKFPARICVVPWVVSIRRSYLRGKIAGQPVAALLGGSPGGSELCQLDSVTSPRQMKLTG